MAVQELKSLLKQNDGKGRGSDRQQIAEQPELLERKYFGGGKKMEEDLQPVTKYLKLTLVFMWSSAILEKFNFCFASINKILNLGGGDWALG